MLCHAAKLAANAPIPILAILATDAGRNYGRNYGRDEWPRRMPRRMASTNGLDEWP
jgi:hypothetical protein